ncbi:MAG: hypothetical protein WA191_07190 [Telluria sp.]
MTNQLQVEAESVASVLWAALDLNNRVVYQHESRANVEMNSCYIKTPTRVVGLVAQDDIDSIIAARVAAERQKTEAQLMLNSVLLEDAALAKNRVDKAEAALAASQAAPDHALAKAIHYPDCWDTAAYSTLSDALAAVYHDFQCSECQAAPAKVEGWQLVPPHATPEMLKAFFAEDYTQNGYIEMLRAAPAATSTQPGDPT